MCCRVAQLPPELQNDPNMLYSELAKLNKSMKWSEATPAARHEARMVQDKLLSRIEQVAKNDATFGNTRRDGLLETIDPGRIHLKTVPEIPPVGEEPEKFHKKNMKSGLRKKWMRPKQRTSKIR